MDYDSDLSPRPPPRRETAPITLSFQEDSFPLEGSRGTPVLEEKLRMESFQRDTPIVESSPRITASSRSTPSHPGRLKPSALNLSRVSAATVQSLPSQALTNIIQQRKSVEASQESECKSYFQELSTPVYERMVRWRNNSEVHAKAAKKDIIEKELQQCSFKPELAPKTHTLLKPHSESVQTRTLKWQEARERKLEQTKVTLTQAKIEEETNSDCPFRPTLLRADAQKGSFDGGSFYMRNVQWQKEVSQRTQGKYQSPTSAKTHMMGSSEKKKKQRHSDVGVQLERELRDFQHHAVRVQTLLHASPGPYFSQNPFPVQSSFSNRLTLRHELLTAKISLLEEQVAGALQQGRVSK